MGHGTEAQHLRCVISVGAEIPRRSLQLERQGDPGRSADNSHEKGAPPYSFYRV